MQEAEFVGILTLYSCTSSTATFPPVIHWSQQLARHFNDDSYELMHEDVTFTIILVSH
jgi:hypothetical protein